MPAGAWARCPQRGIPANCLWQAVADALFLLLTPPDGLHPMNARLLIITACCALLALPSRAQEGESRLLEGTLRVVSQASGDTHIFQTRDIPARYGFVVYRQHEGQETRITDTPVRGAQSASAFRSELSGERMAALQERLGVSSPLEVYYELRADRTTALRFALTDTTLARALGYLHVDEEAPEGTVTYRAEFVGPNGNPTGEELTETTQVPGERPAAPTDLSASQDGEQLSLTWSYPATTTDIPDNVVSFRVYQVVRSGRERVTPGEVQLRLVRKSEQTKRIPVPPAGTTYRFFVVAVDVTSQESLPSDTLRFTVEDKTPPAPPQGVRARVPEEEAVEVNWLISPEPDVAGYHVYRTTRVIEKGTRLTSEPLPSDSTSYIDSTFAGGGQYIYRITAVDSAGNESGPGQDAQAFVNDRTPPSAPSAISAQYDSSSGRMRLTWQHDSESGDFAGYALLRRELGESALFTRLDSDGTDGRSLVDEGPAGQGFREGGRYRYGVAARDEAKNFSDTTFTTVKVRNVTPPERPERFVARSPDGLDIDLRWTSPPDRDVTTYRIYRRTGDTTAAQAEMPDTAVAEVPAPTTFFEDTTAAVPNTYVYRIAAVDSVGLEGTMSEPVQFTLRDDAPPRPVRNVQAVVTDSTETRLTETPSAKARDVRVVWGRVAAPDLSGYRVYRASLPTGTYEPVHTAGPESTAWTDPSGSVGTWYRVRALDTSGNQSRPSEPAQAQSPEDR